MIRRKNKTTTRTMPVSAMTFAKVGQLTFLSSEMISLMPLPILWKMLGFLVVAVFAAPFISSPYYLLSLCRVCFLQNGQYFISSILSGVFFLFL